MYQAYLFLCTSCCDFQLPVRYYRYPFLVRWIYITHLPHIPIPDRWGTPNPGVMQVNAKAAQVEIIVHKAQADENFRRLAGGDGRFRIVQHRAMDVVGRWASIHPRFGVFFVLFCGGPKGIIGASGWSSWVFGTDLKEGRAALGSCILYIIYYIYICYRLPKPCFS